MNLSTFNACVKVIENHRYSSREEMMQMLDVFLLNKRITPDQYNVLVAMLEEQEEPAE